MHILIFHKSQMHAASLNNKEHDKVYMYDDFDVPELSDNHSKQLGLARYIITSVDVLYTDK